MPYGRTQIVMSVIVMVRIWTDKNVSNPFDVSILSCLRVSYCLVSILQFFRCTHFPMWDKMRQESNIALLLLGSRRIKCKQYWKNGENWHDLEIVWTIEFYMLCSLVYYVRSSLELGKTSHSYLQKHCSNSSFSSDLTDESHWNFPHICWFWLISLMFGYFAQILYDIFR